MRSTIIKAGKAGSNPWKEKKNEGQEKKKERKKSGQEYKGGKKGKTSYIKAALDKLWSGK